MPFLMVCFKLPKWNFVTDHQEWHYKVLNKEEYERVVKSY